MSTFITKKDVDDCITKEYDPDNPYKPVRDLQSYAIAEAERGNHDYAKVILNIAEQKSKEIVIEIGIDVMQQIISGQFKP